MTLIAIHLTQAAWGLVGFDNLNSGDVNMSAMSAPDVSAAYGTVSEVSDTDMSGMTSPTASTTADRECLIRTVCGKCKEHSSFWCSCVYGEDGSILVDFDDISAMEELQCEVCKIDKTVLTVEYWLPVDSDASLSDSE